MSETPTAEKDVPRTHVLKVQPPYFDDLLDGSKTFEVRKNDRAFQRGDELWLWETEATYKDCARFPDCLEWADHGHRHLRRRVTFVYSGDPRFGGIEPGHVVLGLGEVDDA